MFDDDEDATALEAPMYDIIKTLNERIWEGRVGRNELNQWLANFSNGYQPDVDKRHALYFLSRFMYFGDREIREMLRTIFRDLYKYPIVAKIRQRLMGTTNSSTIDEEFSSELSKTRFLGIGNPSESGTHLLYYFRQENRLVREQFINAHAIFDDSAERTIRDPDVRRYVFLDDFCGTGTQASDYSKIVVEEIRRLYAQQGIEVAVFYYVLCGTSSGLQQVRANTKFDAVECVLELDDTYTCFGPNSRYFRQTVPGIDPTIAKHVASAYGQMLNPLNPLGYKNAQLLVGFHHNTPDNTLPIIWYDEEERRDWQPIFKRYPKVAYRGASGPK